MAFVFASTSAIDRLFEQRSKRLQSAATSGSFEDRTNAPIRRPYRGIQIKEDTYATMSIVDGSGKPIPLVSESSPQGFGIGKGSVETYADFILQQISEERTEKQQVIETFGDSFIFFFGERPRILNIDGLLMNTDDFGWRAQFMDNYENLLRGSKLVQRNARLYLAWDTIVVEGYPINMSASEDVENPYTVNFQMQIFLTNYRDFGRIGLTEFPPAPRDTQTFDALNRDLDNNRYISTTAEVRAQNFLSREGGAGLGGFLREGIRSINSITNFVGDAFQDAATLLSGRVVRKPLGIAGFLSQVGQGNVAAAGFSQTIADLFEFGGLTDTKLTIPRRSRFHTVDESILRTTISANVDEYPLLEGTVLPTRWSAAEQFAFQSRQIRREQAQVEQQAVLTAAAIAAQGEAEVLETVQDIISFAKTGFALVNTTRAVVANPGAAGLEALGLQGVF